LRGLKNKRVLITGGAKGIGKATAERFLEEESRVVVLDRDEKALKDLSKKLSDLSGIINADVTDPKAVVRSFNELNDIFNGLDILINNAGISIRHSFIDITLEDWSTVLDVNLKGVFIVAQKAAQFMLNERGGVILNMGSSNGLMGYPYYAAYNASKAGVIGMTKTAAKELMQYNIRTHAIMPTLIDTPIFDKLFAIEGGKWRRYYESRIPLGLGDPKYIADVIAFLCSEESFFMNGAIIEVNGGRLGEV